MKIKCGGVNKPKKGFVCISKYKEEFTDIIVDLDKYPLPFKSNSVEFIDCVSVMEHIIYPIDLMLEFQRILKKGGRIKIVVPFYNYPKSAYNDISHIHYFGLRSFDNMEKYHKDFRFKRIYKNYQYSKIAFIKSPLLATIIPYWITFIEWMLEKK